MPVSHQFRKVCSNCKAYCCSNVRPPITKDEKQIITNSGFKDHFIKIRNGIYEIKPGKDGNCPYLKKDFTCEIHKVKPKLCKVWPVVPRLKLDKKNYIVIKCPLYKYLSKEDLIEAKNEAENISTSIIQHLWKMSHEIKNKFKIYDYEEI